MGLYIIQTVGGQQVQLYASVGQSSWEITKSMRRVPVYEGEKLTVPEVSKTWFYAVVDMTLGGVALDKIAVEGEWDRTKDLYTQFYDELKKRLTEKGLAWKNDGDI
jgi:hypothetical protein